MGTLTRDSFARGWVPSADAVGAPPDSLLRADNLVLDERGVLSLRQGSSKINGSALADTDVHSLYTVNLSGTRYRMAGANNAVYANSSSIATSVNGSGDIQFGSYLGQIVFARGTTTKKYDGSTVRTWGIAAPNAAPTLAVIAADSEVFSSWDSSDTANITMVEDDGTGKAFAAGFDATANGALVINPDQTTGRGRAYRTFATPQDFTTYDGGQVTADSDVIEIWMYVTEPQYLNTLTIRIDVNDATYKDMYGYVFRFQSEFQEENTPVTVGWNLLQIRKDQMIRSAGATAGKNWSTVKQVEVDVLCTVGGSAAQVKFDRWRIVGGASRPLTGIQRYKLVAVYNSSTYTGLSAPSAVSADIETTAQGVTITIGAGIVSALDTQVNEIWAYRFNETLGDYYRIGTKTGGPWAGAQTISDTMSDADALTANIVLQDTNTTPPSTIVGIAGPHYDRIFALTATHLYPSQQRNLDSFASDQVIRVGDASEVAYWVVKVREELYVGTSKDIYRLVGDWALRSDGLVNVSKVPLGIGAPPISDAIAQDGDTLVYLAADGWRQVGTSVALTSGDVELLYRGYTRHGVSPANLSTGRFKAALTKGWLSAITPEGASTTSSTVLHRYAAGLQRWYRHTYGRSWRCIYREPDGTLIASDNAGFVWVLDTGTQDDGSDIAVVLWTPVEDNGQPNIRKDGWELRVRANTNGTTATVALHLDGSGSSSTSLSSAASDLTPTAGSLSSISAFRQAQLRVTGSFSTFLWYDYTITYRERPAVLTYAEPKPDVRGTRRKRFAGFTVILDTLGAAATVTPVIDDSAQSGQSVTTSDAVSTTVTFANVVGRDLWATISKATGFEYYGLEPIVVAEFPPIIRGRIPDSNAGHPGVKRVTGIRIRACTLGSARTFTPILDGTSQTTTFTLTTSADDPDEVVHSFSEPQDVTDVAWSVDGNIELYDWFPLVDHRLPLGRKLWDTGPVEFGTRAHWVVMATLKAKITGAVTVTPYVDDIAQDAVTVPVNYGVRTYDVKLARPVRGRQVRFVLSSEYTFYPYWLEPRYRLTGTATDLKSLKVGPEV